MITRARVTFPIWLVLLCFSSAPARAQIVFNSGLSIAFDFDAGPTSIARGDLNGDNIADLVVTGRNTEGLVLLLMGNAAGGFEEPIPLDFGSQTDWAILEHFDTDAHLDLAVALRGGLGIVAVLAGNGDGTFAERVDYAAGRGNTHMAAADFDGDQDIDVVVAGNLSDTITLLLNDGNGQFPDSRSVHFARLSRSIPGGFYLTTADYDNDQDIDVAVAKSEGRITVMLNNGDATFARPIEYAAHGTPTGIASGDVDLDGDIDIVFADLAFFGMPGQLAVLHNQGDGQFAGLSKFPYFGGNAMWYVTVADFNGDARPDAIMSDALGVSLIVYENQTEDQGLDFGFPQPLFIGGYPRSMFAVDHDGDCDLDLLVANIGQHRVQLLVNETQENPCGRFAGSVRRFDQVPRIAAPGGMPGPSGTARRQSLNLARSLAEWPEQIPTRE